MKNNIIDIIFIILFLGIYILGFIFIYFIAPILNKKYFEQFKKEMGENERKINGIK